MGTISLIITLIFKLIMVTIFSILVFAEWNNRIIQNDLKIITITIYIDIISLIVLFFLHFISIDSFNVYIITRELLIYITALLNYILLYGYKIILSILHKQNINETFITNINKEFISSEKFDTKMKSNQIASSKNYSTTDYTTNNYTQPISYESTTSDQAVSHSKSSFFSKIISYHYSPGPMQEAELVTSITTQSEYTSVI